MTLVAVTLGAAAACGDDGNVDDGEASTTDASATDASTSTGPRPSSGSSAAATSPDETTSTSTSDTGSSTTVVDASSSGGTTSGGEQCVCGDGLVECEELCDDGDDEDSDGCDADCTPSIVSIVAGAIHTCVLLDIGTVRCWGDNLDGQLGYAHTNFIGDDEEPWTAGDVDVGGSVVQLAAGAYHNCALLDDGAVRCWGLASNGTVGFPYPETWLGDDETPAAAEDVSLGEPALTIAAAAFSTFALLESGAVRCWGLNQIGQLGLGHVENVGDDELPSEVPPVSVGDEGAVLQIGASGGDSACVRFDVGDIRCWGENDYGKLGYGHLDNIGDDELPSSVAVVDVGGFVEEVASGRFHACARLDDGAVRCWGAGTVGSLGYANIDHIGDDELPSSAGDIDVGGAVVDIELSDAHTCALLDTGAVRCWGFGFGGMLGYGSPHNIGDDEPPSAAGDVDVGGTVVQLALGASHTCALLESGAVRCWGSWGMSGDPDISEFVGDDETPASVPEVRIFF